MMFVHFCAQQGEGPYTDSYIDIYLNMATVMMIHIENNHLIINITNFNKPIICNMKSNYSHVNEVNTKALERIQQYVEPEH